MNELSARLADTLPQDFEGSLDWLSNLRNDGARQFRAHGLPSRKDEAWKYTGLGMLDQSETQLATEGLSTGVTPTASSGLATGTGNSSVIRKRKKFSLRNRRSS